MGIYRRGKIWWVRFEINGEEIRRSARTASRIVALRYEITLKEESARIARGGRARRTYREGMERFIVEYLPTLKPQSAKRYISSARKLFEHFQGLHLDEINQATVKLYIAARRAAGKTAVRRDGTKVVRAIDAATVKRDIACLGSMLTRCVEWDWLDANPLHGTKKLGLKERDDQWRSLVRDEYDRLLRSCPPMLRDLVIVAVATGLRKEELLSLKWRQVDLRRKEITLEETKSRKPRVVPLSDEAAAQIAAQLPHISQPWVWHRDGGRLVAIRQGWIGACRRAGLEGLRFHDLRHTFATWAAKGEHEWQDGPMDAERRAKWMGHSTVRMQARYTHLETEDLHRAIRRESAQNPAQGQGTELSILNKRRA